MDPICHHLDAISRTRSLRYWWRNTGDAGLRVCNKNCSFVQITQICALFSPADFSSLIPVADAWISLAVFTDGMLITCKLLAPTDSSAAYSTHHASVCTSCSAFLLTHDLQCSLVLVPSQEQDWFRTHGQRPRTVDPHCGRDRCYRCCILCRSNYSGVLTTAHGLHQIIDVIVFNTNGKTNLHYFFALVRAVQTCSDVHSFFLVYSCKAVFTRGFQFISLSSFLTSFILGYSNTLMVVSNVLDINDFIPNSWASFRH